MRRRTATTGRSASKSRGARRPTDAQHTLAQTFLKRSVSMLERVTSAASPEVLKAALSSPTDVGGVAALLSNMAPLGMDLSSVDPFVEAMARGAGVKRELLKDAGGSLSASQVALALGITRQAVDKRRTRGALLAVPSGSGEYLYPACQFTSQGVVPDLEEVLRSFQFHNPWTQLSALMAPAPALEGKTILEALQSGDVERAVRLVSSFGEQA